MKKIIIMYVTLFCAVCFAQRKYIVKARTGLIIRESTTINSERLGKLPYNYHFKVDEKEVKRLDTINEIVGNWVPVKNEAIKGYVFDGFMKRLYDIKYYRLYGQVKSLKKYSYYPENKEKIKYDEHIIFNKRGIKTEVYDYDKGWELDEEYIYNNKNQLISRYKYSNFYEYKYDEKGNEVERGIFDKNKILKNKVIKAYDDKGNNISYEYYDAKRNKSDKSIYIYNTKNKYTKAIHYDYDGNLKSKYIYEYLNDTILTKKYKIDSSNNKRLIGKRILNDSLDFLSEKYIEYFHKENQYNKGKIYTSIEKVFNKKNELIKKVTYDSAESQLPNIGFSGGGGNFDERTIKLYKNGELTSVKEYREFYYKQKEQEVLIEDNSYKQNYSNEIYYSYYSDHKNIYRKEYYYNYNDNLIKYVKYKIDDLKTINTTEEFMHVFDKNGNWIEKNIFKNGKLYKVYKQEIEYY